MEKTCCVTGSRPQGFKWNYYNKRSDEYIAYRDNIKAIVTGLVDEGYTHFIAGGAMGADTDFAEVVLEVKSEINSNIVLELAVPFDGHTSNFTMSDIARFKRTLELADKVTYTSSKYATGVYHVRNRYMVDKSSTVIAFWTGKRSGGTFYTMNYAQKHDKKLITVNL